MTLHAGLLRGHHLDRPLASGLDIEGLRVAWRQPVISVLPDPDVAMSFGRSPSKAFRSVGEIEKLVALYGYQSRTRREC